MKLNKGQIINIIRAVQCVYNEFEVKIKDNFNYNGESYLFRDKEITIVSVDRVISIQTTDEELDKWIKLRAYDSPYVARLTKGIDKGRTPLTFLRDEELYQIESIKTDKNVFTFNKEESYSIFLNHLVKDSEYKGYDSAIAIGETNRGKTVELYLGIDKFVRKFVSEDWKQIIIFENKYESFSEVLGNFVLKELHLFNNGMSLDEIIEVEENFAELSDKSFKHVVV